MTLLGALAGCRAQAEEGPMEAFAPPSDDPSRLADPAPSEATSPSATSAPLPTAPVRVAFVGDLNLSLKVGIHLDRMAAGEPVPPDVGSGYPFVHVAERLRAADFLVGNLECVASPKGSLATDHNPFRCAQSSIEVLKNAGFDLVSVANNHALDFGPLAFEDMLVRLDAGGLPHFGKETFSRKQQEPFVATLAGLRIGFLAYYYPPKTMRDVEAARPSVDVLIAFMHWGQEDDPRPMLLQKRLARQLIGAGVDAVVGTHAHVVQPTDEHEGHFIAYGLGNFVFSGMTHSELHRTGQLLELDIHPDRRIEPRLLTIRLDEQGAPHFVDP
jgi:hypothetical protein